MATVDIRGQKLLFLMIQIGRYLMPTNGGLLIAGMCSQKYAAKMEKAVNRAAPAVAWRPKRRY